jgi:DNA-binding transcriptional MerR regulator
MTVSELSRRTGICPGTLRLYSDAGWITCMYTARGDRLFQEAAVEQARQVRESRARSRTVVSVSTEAT